MIHSRYSAGDDTILGGTGDDLVFAGPGADSIDGGDGADTIYGGSGADSIVSGAGADDLRFFSTAEDRLMLDDALWSGSHGALSAAQVVSTFGAVQGSHYVLDFGGGNSITFFNQAGITGLEGAIDIV